MSKVHKVMNLCFDPEADGQEIVAAMEELSLEEKKEVDSICGNIAARCKDVQQTLRLMAVAELTKAIDAKLAEEVGAPEGATIQ